MERMASIEREPRTLSLEQLRYAREAALQVLSTKSLEEALCIFTKGLKPVISIRRNGMDSDEETELLEYRLDRGDHLTKRDIVTAPF